MINEIDFSSRKGDEPGCGPNGSNKQYGKALEFLRTNELLHMSMIFPILRGTVELIYTGDDGVLLKELESNSYMLAAYCFDKGKQLIDSVGRKELFCVHQKPFADYLLGKYDYQHQLVCYQAVYFDKEHIKKGAGTQSALALDIKRLGAEYIDVICEHYNQFVDQQYIIDRLTAGAIYGGFSGDTLCGFVGTHEEGSIGLLEVIETYRRRGFGEELLCYMAHLILDRGQTPFSQISTDNEISIKLHKKLGFKVSSDTIHWLF